MKHNTDFQTIANGTKVIITHEYWKGIECTVTGYLAGLYSLTSNVGKHDSITYTLPDTMFTVKKVGDLKEGHPKEVADNITCDTYTFSVDEWVEVLDHSTVENIGHVGVITFVDYGKREAIIDGSIRVSLSDLKKVPKPEIVPNDTIVEVTQESTIWTGNRCKVREYNSKEDYYILTPLGYDCIVIVNRSGFKVVEEPVKDASPVTTDFTDAINSVREHVRANVSGVATMPTTEQGEHLETHQEALQRLNLQVGDTVKVLCNAESDHKRGWYNSWVPEMDRYIGKTCTVDDWDERGISFIGNGWHFPAYVLEVVSRVGDEKKGINIPELTKINDALANIILEEDIIPNGTRVKITHVAYRDMLGEIVDYDKIVEMYAINLENGDKKVWSSTRNFEILPDEPKQPETPILNTKPFDIHEAIDKPENVVYDKYKVEAWSFTSDGCIKGSYKQDVFYMDFNVKITNPLLRLIDYTPIVERYENIYNDLSICYDSKEKAIEGHNKDAIAIVKLSFRDSLLIAADIVHEYNKD